MALPWDSKSNKDSISIKTPSPDGKRPDPSGRTDTISDNNRSASKGTFAPSSAKPEHIGGGVPTPSVPASGKIDLPWASNSADRSGSNTNESK